MARTQLAQLALELPDEDPVEPVPEAPPPSPRRSRSRSTPPEPSAGWRQKLRLGLIWTGVCLGVIALVVAGYQIDEFLASDAHFLLPANGSPLIDGATYTPRAEVTQVFARDFGRSIYLTPLAQRRLRLLSIDWIQDASVLRRWPNRISVRIAERKPIAFAMLPGADGRSSISEVALIDADGVILRPPARAKFSLPALAGVSRQDRPEVRRARARQAAQLIHEVQSYSGQISEIDVSDPENVTVIEEVGGHPVRLRLGNQNYLARLSNFLSHYPDISRRLPNARTFDLRLDDHITAQDGGPSGK